MLSYWMLKVEHESEKEPYTHGDKVLAVLLSLLSIAMIFFILFKAWSVTVNNYWGKPVNKNNPE